MAKYALAALTALLLVVVATRLVRGPGDDSLEALGTISDVRPTTDCVSGYDCEEVTVTCPGVDSAGHASVAQLSSKAPPRGMVTFFIGSGGDKWYSADGGTTARNMMSRLAAEGYHVVQVKWESPWLFADEGEDAGPAKLACRPATVVDWIYQTKFTPLQVPDGLVGQCGFCVSGNSAGASQASYAVSHYGLDTILDALVLSGGPPHASQDKGCLDREEEYRYSSSNRHLIDSSYGFLDGGGPCKSRDADFVTRWQSESVDTGSADFHHPRTRVDFLFGADDATPGVGLGQEYHARLLEATTPYVSSQTVPGAGHGLHASRSGADALYAAITASAG